jgi:hypothetical protein
MKRMSVSPGAVAFLTVIVPLASAQQRAIPQASLTQLRRGADCLSLFAGLDTPEELRNLKKKTEKGQTKFYRGNSEITDFPAEITMEVHIFPGCRTDGPWFKNPPAWPNFANDLKFELFWKKEQSKQDAASQMPVVPTKVTKHQEPWAEYGSQKEFTFTIPAKSVPLSSQLWVQVSAEGEKVGEFTLQFDVLDSSKSPRGQRRAFIDQLPSKAESCNQPLWGGLRDAQQIPPRFARRNDKGSVIGRKA